MKIKVQNIAKVIIGVCAIILLVFICKYSKGNWWQEKAKNNPLAGKGTLEEPYLINDINDLKWFRDSVNSGEGYEDTYFLQTTDIDLASEKWVPIGEYGSGNYFYGIYDGGSRRIFNLNIVPEDESLYNVGFFGQLGGMVVNLGIESGIIEGSYIGAFTSHAAKNTAIIANCYNKATVTGTGRAGGICDNFNGKVINCVNMGNVTASQSAQIVGYNAASICNVYPQENVYPPTFEGSYVQYLGKLSEEESLYDWLNRGVDYLEQYEIFEPGLLKKWEEN